MRDCREPWVPLLSAVVGTGDRPADATSAPCNQSTRVMWDNTASFRGIPAFVPRRWLRWAHVARHRRVSAGHRPPRGIRLPSRAHPLGLRAGVRAGRRRGRARHRRDPRRRARPASRERDLGHDGCRDTARIRRPAHDARGRRGGPHRLVHRGLHLGGALDAARSRAPRRRQAGERELRRALPGHPVARAVRAHRHGRRRAAPAHPHGRRVQARRAFRGAGAAARRAVRGRTRRRRVGRGRRAAHHGGVRADPARPARGTGHPGQAGPARRGRRRAVGSRARTRSAGADVRLVRQRRGPREPHRAVRRGERRQGAARRCAEGDGCRDRARLEYRAADRGATRRGRARGRSRGVHVDAAPREPVPRAAVPSRQRARGLRRLGGGVRRGRGDRRRRHLRRPPRPRGRRARGRLGCATPSPAHGLDRARSDGAPDDRARRRRVSGAAPRIEGT